MQLVVATCSRDGRGGYWNEALAAARQHEPTSVAEIDKQLDSLAVFSDRLDKVHKNLKAKGLCHCKKEPRAK